MNARESIARHPWRWTAAAAVVLILIALLAAALFVRLLLQPQRFTALLQSQLANAGLTLSVDKPAAPVLWPHPGVQLQGFQLSSIGASAPLLAASEARIVVPWHALLHRELAIERLEIQSPRIDLDQLQALLSKLPHTGGAPQLPRIGAGLRIVNGTLVRDEQPLLFDVNAETGALLPGVPFHLTASARNGADRAGSMTLSALPQYRNGALRFEQARLGVNLQRGPRGELAGDVTWRGGSDVAVSGRGTLSLPAPIAPAASSIASAASTATPSAVPRDYTIALQILPAQGATPLTAALKLDGANEHVDARVQPRVLMDWWQRILAATPGSALALPPLDGQAQVDDITYGPLHMQGVQAEAGPNVAPLAAGSAPAPASTAAKPGVAH